MTRGSATIGCEFGDEGKGKIHGFLITSAIEDTRRFKPELLESDEPIILTDRYQGSNNAGHTVYFKGKKYELHVIPSGIVFPHTYAYCGKKMLFNPRAAFEELQTLMDQGVEISERNFGIATTAHVTLEFHVDQDRSSYDLPEHSSTGKGVKQTAKDKYFREGIRFCEFLDRDLMLKILQDRLRGHEFAALFDLEGFVDSYATERDFLRPFEVLESEVMKRNFMFRFPEGAQSVLLDIDDGLHPGITSSSPGEPTHFMGNKVGVFKSYISSVGIKDRPFVTEMEEDVQKTLREIWGEFGTTTRKPRHLGYFDVVSGKYALASAQINQVALTCLDRLEDFSKLDKPIKVAVYYSVDGINHTKWHKSFDKRETLYRAVPIYEEFEPWDRTVERDEETLTPPAEAFVKSLEDLLGMSIDIVGTGPENEDIVLRHPIDI